MSIRKVSRIQWTLSAWEDIEEISTYLLMQGETQEFVNACLQYLTQAPKYLVRFPYAGKQGRMPKTRKWRVQRTPYALIYTVHKDGVHILRVMHDSRNIAL